MKIFAAVKHAELAALAAIFAVLLWAAAQNAVADVRRIENVSPTSTPLVATYPGNAASGGRAIKMGADASSPGVFYAATEWGGLFKSTDNGRSWWHLSGHVPQATWDVKVHREDSNRVIATSFFDGRVQSRSGINVSTDGGVTWSHPGTATPPAGFCRDPVMQRELRAHSIVFDPVVPDTVYVGTACGLAISDDAGASWRYVNPERVSVTGSPRGAAYIWDVIVHHGIIDICGGDGPQRSTDGGVNWSLPGFIGTASGSGYCSLAASPDEPDVIFAMRVNLSTLYESHDGGRTWPVNYGVTPVAYRPPRIEINDRAGNGYDLWLFFVYLQRSQCQTPAPGAPTDGPRCAMRAPGEMFWPIYITGTHLDMSDIVFDPLSSTDACPRLLSNDGGIYYETSGVNPTCHTPEWRQADRTPQALWLYDLDGRLSSSGDRLRMAAGLQDDGALFSENAREASVSWDHFASGDIFNSVLGDTSIVSRGLLATRRHAEPISLFGFVVVAPPPGNFRIFSSRRSMLRLPSDELLVATTEGVFVSTEAFGLASEVASWTPLSAESPPQPCAFEVAVDSAGDMSLFAMSTEAGDRYCGGDLPATLWRFDRASPDRGWHRIERDGVSQFGVYGVDPTDPDHIIAADLQGGEVTMVRTVTGGMDWEVSQRLNTLMEGRDATGAARFVAWNESGPVIFSKRGYPQPMMVAFNPHDPDVILVGAADAGLFLSVDGGVRWRLITNPYTPRRAAPHIPRPIRAVFDKRAEDDYNIYVATIGRGIWRIDLYTGPNWGGVCVPAGAFGFSRTCPPPWAYRPDGIDLLCLSGSECRILDNLPVNCPVKWGGRCPGCEEGLCPPFYDITMEGLDPDWTVTLFDRSGRRAPHDLIQMQGKTILRFRPDEDLYIENFIGDYYIGFDLSADFEAGVSYPVRMTLELTPIEENTEASGSGLTIHRPEL